MGFIRLQSVMPHVPSSSDNSSFSDSDNNTDDSESSSSEREPSADSDDDAETPASQSVLAMPSPPVYSRFNPGEGDRVVFTLPTQEIVTYATRCFTQFVSDQKIKETVSDESPVPTGVPSVEVPRVDDYISDIFASRKQDYGKYSDDSWMKERGHVLDIMGPLSNMWATLDTVHMNDESGEELDLYDLLDLIEKCITFVGQAHISMLYFRKRDILYKMTHDMKKAKQSLKKHDMTQMKSYSKLFGKAFYNQLMNSAKVRKASKEIISQ